MFTFAKLKSPLLGRGKMKVTFSKAFESWDPEDQVTALDQCMKHLNAVRREAARNARIKFEAEDAANASQIRAKTV